MKLTFLSAVLAFLCMAIAPAAHAQPIVIVRPHHRVYHHWHHPHRWHHRYYHHRYYHHHYYR